jgi:hypothetical protein
MAFTNPFFSIAGQVERINNAAAAVVDSLGLPHLNQSTGKFEAAGTTRVANTNLNLGAGYGLVTAAVAGSAVNLVKAAPAIATAVAPKVNQVTQVIKNALANPTTKKISGAAATGVGAVSLGTSLLPSKPTNTPSTPTPPIPTLANAGSSPLSSTPALESAPNPTAVSPAQIIDTLNQVNAQATNPIVAQVGQLLTDTGAAASAAAPVATLTGITAAPKKKTTKKKAKKKKTARKAKRRTTKRKGRKLKFGSKAYRKKYLRHR